jgi:hypothetical protein
VVNSAESGHASVPWNGCDDVEGIAEAENEMHGDRETGSGPVNDFQSRRRPQEGDSRSNWCWDNWATYCTPCAARGNPESAILCPSFLQL